MRVIRTLNRSLVSLVFGALGAVSLFGCERKAPGPQECAWFAGAFVGMDRDDERMTLRIQSEIDEVTQLCLTAPYDRELIACAQSTHRARDCFDAYKRRTRRAL